MSRNIRSCTSQIVRFYTQGGVKPPAPSTATNVQVTGLTSKCVKPASGPVGPGASADSAHYKVPEYFCYNRFSFAEAEIEMAKYRLPQPSALNH